MPKKILAFIVIGAGILLGLFLFKDQDNNDEGKKNAKTTAVLPSSTITPSSPSPIKASDLNNTKLKPNKRAAMLMAIAPTPSQDQTWELIVFINSQNPYHKEGVVLDPHSYEAYQFQREASLRIFALRTLSERLGVEDFEEVVETIEKDSRDQAIKRVARQALEFKKAGRNYFKEMKNAIQAAPLPERMNEK